MRQSYLKRGGNNPAVLNEMGEMENEALSMETRNARLSTNKRAGTFYTLKQFTQTIHCTDPLFS